MHLAPEDGYVPSISVEMPAMKLDWVRNYGTADLTGSAKFSQREKIQKTAENSI
jgi:hypothetical protein